MNIQSALSIFSSSNVAALYGASQGERSQPAQQKPVEAVAREVDSARVQLSAFGQVQSAAANVQSTSQNLQDAEQLSSVTDTRKAAEAFVQSFNEQRAALAKAGSQDDSGRAMLASAQMQGLTNEMRTAFADAGISVSKDGTLSVDAKALESAYNANPTAVTRALGEVGRAAEVTATRQLSESGSVGAAMKAAENRVERLETRQNAVQFSNEVAQRATEAATQRYGFGAFGAGAYLGIFGL
ncbi:MAG: hypothetical protein RBT86_01755 [Azospira sp.]|jgi:hypothetical protein|nr:hypothetical protein [Azospira sp.]